MLAKIKPREQKAIISSLRVGVTPRIGLEHIQVGRDKEIKAMMEELDAIREGSSCFKFIIGDYGAGKSFFLQLIRYMALQKGIVVCNADLSPDRRLYASSGQARALYQELSRNISTKTHSQGNAMPAIVEKFIEEQMQIAHNTNSTVSAVIAKSLSSLSELVGGYDFAHVINKYYEAYETGNELLKNNAIKYLRGEYANKLEAKRDLDVRTIVDDSNVYDRIKLLGRFVKLAGYRGLLVNLDEMVNIYKLPNSRTRNYNYEQILRMLNDCLQGSVEYMGFLMGGTPDFMLNEYKGLYSYDALRSRLCLNDFAQRAGVVDFKGPVLVLENLLPEEMVTLLYHIRDVFANREVEKYLVPDEAITAFLSHCYEHIGESYFRTPRNTIKAFVDLLSVLEQNPELKWRDLLGTVDIKQEEADSIFESEDNEESSNDELSDFKL